MQTDQTELRALLTRPDHPDIKLLSDGGPTRITARQAHQMVSRGAEFLWNGRNKRVKWIRIATVRAPWMPCYRTTEAVTLSPSIDWLFSLRASYATEVNA